MQNGRRKRRRGHSGFTAGRVGATPPERGERGLPESHLSFAPVYNASANGEKPLAPNSKPKMLRREERMKKSITMGILVAGVLIAATASAQTQDKPQQKCINAMNKGMNKIAATQLKANNKCVSDFAKGKNLSASGCYLTPAKVTAAQTKNDEQATKKCTTPPSWGPTGSGSINNYAAYHAHEVADDLLGSPPDSGVAICGTSKPHCKCQSKVLKAATKLYSTSQKVFNKCKKAGLKDKVAPFDAVTDLDACASTDPKNKIAKALTKLDGAITKSCPAEVTNPFPGDCNMLTGAALGDCVEDLVRCHLCITWQGGDNMTIDCDIYDNGDDDGSCFDDF
jgi:hypothetical protein